MTSNLTVLQIREKLLKKELSSEEITTYYLNQIEKKDKKLNSYITVDRERALRKAKEFDNDFKNRKDLKLGGVPISIKDIFSTKDMLTTAASHMLNGYIPVYESTVTERLINEGAILLGKTNLDQFCHGSSTISSYYGTTRNPHDLEKLPGGSSGGSACATAADLCAASIGTETAGSIRLPASWCGTVGLKPSYGRVSRYGVLAMGSSLDSPGSLTKSVEDGALILTVISGYDPKDFSSYNVKSEDFLKNLDPSKIKNMKIGIPESYLNIDIDKGVLKNFNRSIDTLKKLGAHIEYVKVLDTSYAMSVYTITCRSEVASNLARYDGTRFGLEGSNKDTVKDYYESARGEGFGPESKRRIMTGTYSLSAGYADEFFKKSEQVRQLVKNDLDTALDKYDCLISPTTPTTALRDRDAENPLFGEMIDILSEGSSEAGLPAISIPNGTVEGMPTGIQFIGRTLGEQTILNAAKALEENS
jgi:aspartyl-tRNA(Asn)/glutamyl-tRNA(Gln) amidotransferase subunit A